MTRLIEFADGFTSASAPSIAGNSAENYPLLNNQAAFVNITGLDFDETITTTAFIALEIERSDATPALYRQSMTLIASYDGSAWLLEAGSFIGDEMLADSVASPQFVQLQMSGGQVQYKSGNMVGGTYAGEFKFSITRISA